MTFWQPSWGGDNTSEFVRLRWTGMEAAEAAPHDPHRMTEEASAAGLYEGSREDYVTALEAARKRRAT